MHVECGHVVFGKHSKFSMMCYRKCNFVLIDFEVKLLLTFFASMKAKGMSVSKVHVCIHFWVFTHEKLVVFQVSIFKVST